MIVSKAMAGKYWGLKERKYDKERDVLKSAEH
jgi:hypothetical protein